MNLCFSVLFDINYVVWVLFYVFVNECAFFDRFAQQMCFLFQNAHFRSICIEICVFLFKMCIFEAFALKVVCFCSKCAFSKHLHRKLCFFVPKCVFSKQLHRKLCFLFKIVYNHCKMYIVHHVRIQRTCFHHGLYHLGCNWEEPPGRRPLGGNLWEYVIGRTPLGGGP